MPGDHLCTDRTSFNGGFTNTYARVIDAGGTGVLHTTLELFTIGNANIIISMGGYSISFGNSLNGQGGVIYNFDVGDLLYKL
jgi:hypothetical protein